MLTNVILTVTARTVRMRMIAILQQVHAQILTSFIAIYQISVSLVTGDVITEKTVTTEQMK